MRNLLINVHGFLSSHESEKVVELRRYIEQNYNDIEFLSPRLPNNPEPAVELIEKIIREKSDIFDAIALVGHSLGGYFATYIASKNKMKAVLVNPVVRGYEIMCEFYGECYNPHTYESFEITEQDIEFLTSINLESVHDKSLFLVMQQLGDEIIDSETTLSYYAGCATIVERGGCHDFEGLANHAASMVKFLYRQQA